MSNVNVYLGNCNPKVKAGSCWDFNRVSHLAITTRQPPVSPNSSFSHTPGGHSVCAMRTLLEVDLKILSIRREPTLLFKIFRIYPASAGNEDVLDDVRGK